MRSVGNTSNKVNCQACNRAQHPSAVELQLMGALTCSLVLCICIYCVCVYRESFTATSGTQYDSEALWVNDDYSVVERMCSSALFGSHTQHVLWRPLYVCVYVCARALPC